MFTFAAQMEFFDLPMAGLFLAGGVVALAIRKQQAAARLERVKNGEMTEELARKRNRDLSLSGYAFVALGLGIAISHFLSN